MLTLREEASLVTDQFMFDAPAGRRISYALFGADLRAPGTQALLALHGTPGSRLKYKPADRAAADRDLAIIAVDRWAYGDTAAPPRGQQCLSAFAADMAALLDHLGCGVISVVGISGGGPYATAVAAVLGPRVTRLALVAPVGLIRVSASKATEHTHEETTAPMSAFHRFCFRGLGRLPVATAGVFRAYRGILKVRGRAAIAMAMARSGEADRSLLRDDATVAGLANMMREGLKHGTRGPAIDLKLFSDSWDVDPSAITADTMAWFGDQDGSVPEGAIDALVSRIPGANKTKLAGQGHFWVATQFPAVLDWIADQRALERQLK